MTIRALGMISGGLDSLLATKLIMGQGIEVVGVHFVTGFGTRKSDADAESEKDGGETSGAAVSAAAKLGFRLRREDISGEYFKMVQNPRHGYGANMNPCIDCKIFMFSRMRFIMGELGAQFMFTGEVLAQRPMTQHRPTLKKIETKSGMTGLVLRPLSAQLLDPTIPETKGWVDRSRLCGISGRSRTPQIALARQLGLKDFPRPAGGCCHLINPDYSARLDDFLRHKGSAPLDRKTALLLRVGRQFRISPSAKVIVGRDKRENGFMENYLTGRHLFRASGVAGADALAEFGSDPLPEDLERVASIAARYSDAPKNGDVIVEQFFNGERREHRVTPAVESDLTRWRI